MKLLNYLIPSIIINNYTLCKNDVILFIEQLFITPGVDQQLTFQMQGISYKPVTDNNTTITLSIFDVPVFTKDIDLCDYTKCPIPAYESVNITIFENNTLDFPSGLQYNFTIDSKTKTENIFCINFLFSF